MIWLVFHTVTFYNIAFLSVVCVLSTRLVVKRFNIHVSDAQCISYFHFKDSEERVLDPYKATYSPHHHDLQPKMFNSHGAHQEGQLDQLQREFLDSTQRKSLVHI